jgi:prevent-host-death family protein
MAKVDIAEDLVPIGEFKTHASQLLRKLHETGRPLVITQNGKASAVVLTPEEFEQLGYRQYVQQKIKAGERSSETKTYSPEQVVKHLKKRIRAKASEG